MPCCFAAPVLRRKHHALLRISTPSPQVRLSEALAAAAQEPGPDEVPPPPPPGMDRDFPKEAQASGRLNGRGTVQSCVYSRITFYYRNHAAGSGQTAERRGGGPAGGRLRVRLWALDYIHHAGA